MIVLMLLMAKDDVKSKVHDCETTQCKLPRLNNSMTQ